MTSTRRQDKSGRDLRTWPPRHPLRNMQAAAAAPYNRTRRSSRSEPIPAVGGCADCPRCRAQIDPICAITGPQTPPVSVCPEAGVLAYPAGVTHRQQYGCPFTAVTTGTAAAAVSPPATPPRHPPKPRPGPGRPRQPPTTSTRPSRPPPDLRRPPAATAGNAPPAAPGPAAPAGPATAAVPAPAAGGPTMTPRRTVAAASGPVPHPAAGSRSPRCRNPGSPGSAEPSATAQPPAATASTPTAATSRPLTGSPWSRTVPPRPCCCAFRYRADLAVCLLPDLARPG